MKKETNSGVTTYTTCRRSFNSTRESFYNGYLAAIIVDEGSSALVGSVIALLTETLDEIPLAKSQASFSSSPAQTTPSPPPPPPEVAPKTLVAPLATKLALVVTSLAHPTSEGG
ncbi:hypothetical protein J5N97_020974 [Dioscorea zingiberensis]|uniref:Uncharacterized protein n=1 Tax=Dioscorea zingiberensis TaxID=325984 RepID=A0A9D5CJ18_9LILI|nr:hypothetical protein J5N97_020974 [Dioscorea zingiberensis]